MTVSELREALAELPAHYEVSVTTEVADEDGFESVIYRDVIGMIRGNGQVILEA